MFARLFILVVILSLIVACGNDNPTGPEAGVTPQALLGLSDGHTMQYSQVDTTISYEYDPQVSPDPIRIINTTTRSRVVSYQQNGGNWVVRDGIVPMLNLIVSGGYVLQNGFYANYGVDDSLVYFQSPAILMSDNFKVDQPWSYETSPYTSAGDSLTTNFYFSYFGYRANKHYVGREEVLITAGAFNAYRFNVDLYINGTEPAPVATVIEYYSPDIGLVKLRFEDSGFIRTLILVEAH